MKKLIIGREPECDIILYDPTQNTSRRHATLEIGFWGKMYVIDHSQNGTYVNGIPIPRDTKFPVTRNDSVSFAKTAELDWQQVPGKGRAVYLTGGLAVCLLLLIGCLWGAGIFSKPLPAPAPAPLPGIDALSDTTKMETDTTDLPPVVSPTLPDAKKELQEKIEKEKRRLARERAKERKRKEEEKKAKARKEAADSARQQPVKKDSLPSTFIPL